jgi:hypothetical protein
MKEPFVRRAIAVGITTASPLLLGTVAQATPVCAVDIVCTGNVVIIPANERGDRLNVGLQSADGSVRVEGGREVTLEAGTGVPAPGRGQNIIRPQVTFGDAFDGPVTGSLRVTGGGSMLALRGDNTGAIVAGGIVSGGIGLLTVDDGGSLVLTDTSIVDDDPGVNRDVYLDTGQRGGEALVTVDGGTISLLSNSVAGIGLGTDGNGTGTMVVEGGGTVSVRSTGAPDNNGFVDVAIGRNDGGNNVGRLEVRDGDVQLDAPNGGARLDFGQVGSRGTGLISGPDATVTLTGGPDFTIARVGTGAGAVGDLTVENGGQLRVAGSGAVFSSGDQRFGGIDPNTSVGRTTIRSGGEIVVEGTDFGIARLGDDEPDASSASLATLLVEGAGSRFAASDFIEIGADDGVGSTTAIATINDGGSLDAPEIRVLGGGILRGDGGVVNGDLVLGAGGLLAPGLSPGALTVSGDLFLGGGLLEIEIGGRAPGEFDRLEVLGSVFADDPFDLDISFIDGFLPEEGERFSFLSAGSFVGDFVDLAMVSISGLGGGASIALAADEDGVIGFRTENVAPIPLPAGLPLLLAAAAALVGVGRVQRR